MEIGETLLVTTRQEWRDWLAQHHRDRKEIWLIYYKKGSGKTGISYEESVEEALCFGWIDGANKGINEETYAGRFTPRRPKSPWSASNCARVARLLREGRMTEAGLAVLPRDIVGELGDVGPTPPLGREGLKRAPQAPLRAPTHWPSLRSAFHRQFTNDILRRCYSLLLNVDFPAQTSRSMRIMYELR